MKTLRFPRPTGRLLPSAALCAALLALPGCASRQEEPVTAAAPVADTAAADTAAAHHAGPMGAHHASGWKELDDFHTVMMAVWHPVRESNDLGPIRAQAGTLAERADAWAGSTPPASCDAAAAREGTPAVAADARALAALVERNGTDEEVRSALSALHDRFEGVMHACMAHE